MSEDSVLRIEKLSKSFGGLQAVKDVGLSVTKNKIIGLIGPNGSGKSTLFNLITKIIEQDDSLNGNIIYDNQNVNDHETHELAQKGLVRTFQTTKLFDKMTVLENIMIASSNHRGENLTSVVFDIFRKFLRMKTWKDHEIEYTKKAIDILKFLDIYHLIFEKAGVLSGGQRKLLSLGLVLMAAPSVILLDEPVAGVNPTLSNKIFEKINTIRDQGSTFFIVEHNMDVIMESSDFIFVMNKGEVIAADTPEVVQKDPKVLSAYLGGDE